MLELKHLLGDAVEGRCSDPGDDAAGLGRQNQHLLRQFRRQRLGETGQQHSRIRILAGEPDGAMDRHDGLAGARRTGHARRPREGTLDQRPLRRVKEDAPFLPREGESLFQFLLVGDQPDPPQARRDARTDRRPRRTARAPPACRWRHIRAALRRLRPASGRSARRNRPRSPRERRPASRRARRSRAAHRRPARKTAPAGLLLSPRPWRARERRNRMSPAGRLPPHARAPRRSGRRRFADAPRSAGVPPRHRRRRDDRHRRPASCRPSCGRSSGCRD